jgi:hypothetical protein
MPYQFHRFASVWISAVAISGVAGCATVKTQTADIAAEPVKGMVYYLPIRSFDIEVKYVVTNCAADSSGNAILTYDVQPVVKSQLLADRRRAFTIYDGLNGRVLKALNFEITQYENGTLKAINGSVDDRTAETATNVVSGALKLALGLTGTGLYSGGNSGVAQNASITDLNGNKADDDRFIASVRAACGVKITDALVQVRTLTGQIDAAQEALEAKAKLTAAVTGADKGVTDARANLKAAKDTAGVEDLARAQSLLAKAIEKQRKAQDALDAFPSGSPATAYQQRIAAIVQRDLTFVASKTYLPGETESAGDFTISFPDAALRDIGVKTQTPLRANVTFDLLSVKQSPEDAGAGLKAIAIRTTQVDGVWTRAPAMGMMKVCAGDCAEQTVRLSQAFSMPQWGQLAVLPLQSKAFAKSTVKAAFAPDGAITSIYFDSTAPAERASGAFLSASGSIADYVTARRDLKAKLAETKDADEKDAIQQQIDVLDLTAQLANKQTDATTDQKRKLADLDFQIQEVEKQTQLLEASKKLEGMRSAAVPAAR